MASERPDSLLTPGSALATPGEGSTEAITLWWLTQRSGATHSLPQQVAARIAEGIVTARIPPGTHLTEETLAAEFGVSRAPVREALRILQRQQLVEMPARRGARVAPLTEKALRDLVQIWAALLQLIGRELAARGDPALIAELESKAEALLIFAADPQGPARYLWGVQDLTTALAHALGNGYVTLLIDDMMLQIYRYTRLGLAEVAARQQAARRLREVVRQIKRLDGDGAASSFARIAEAARERIGGVLREHPEWSGAEAESPE